MLYHDYVRLSPEALPIIRNAYKFIFTKFGIEWIKLINDTSVDISLLVPRLPHEILFAIGGWINASACNSIEIYDNRAGRWIQSNQLDDHLGRRAYHRAVSIGNKIYCIGGYCNNEYYNTCAVLDLNTRKWKEVFLSRFFLNIQEFICVSIYVPNSNARFCFFFFVAVVDIR